MNTITDNFIKKIEKKDIKEQEIIENEFLNYLTNKKNKILFEEIEEYIIFEINELVNNFVDYDNLEEIIKEYGKDNIIKFLKNETENFSFYFNAKQLLYSYKIIFEIQFENFECYYTDHGDVACYGENISFYYNLNDNFNENEKKIIEFIFCKYLLKDNCWNWLNKYKN